MLDLGSDGGDVRLEVRRGVTRPLWQEGQPGTMTMLEVARGIASEIGFDLTGSSAGGGSDGNFTGALGLATLDTIGARGKGLHILNQHIEILSVVERARLAPGLYCRLGA